MKSYFQIYKVLKGRTTQQSWSHWPGSFIDFDVQVSLEISDALARGELDSFADENWRHLKTYTAVGAAWRYLEFESTFENGWLVTCTLFFGNVPVQGILWGFKTPPRAPKILGQVSKPSK